MSNFFWLSFFFNKRSKCMKSNLCSSKHHRELWCCQQCCWVWWCELQAGSRHSLGEAMSQGSGRCRQTASQGRSCPGQLSRPGRAAPQWPAAPQGTHSDLRLKTATACQGQTSETPHLEEGDMRQELVKKHRMPVNISRRSTPAYEDLDTTHHITRWLLLLNKE